MTVIGPSSEIAGRYLLLQKIAGGGMGEVWQGVDEVLGRPVAVKLLRPDLAGDPTFRERFRNEARSTAGVGHPGIAWVFDYGEEQLAGGGQVAYLVMELVEGEPLSAMLQRKGRLSPAQTLDVVAQAASALQAAHDRGLVHRDVKPANLLVRPDGVLKITDFGIARAADSVSLTDTGTVLGSAPYLSPEQAQGLQATPASDLYSLGVVAYECLAGRTPFGGGAPAAVAAAHVSEAVPALPADVPQPVRQLVSQMLQKDPAQRPGPAGALGAEAAGLAVRLGFEPGALASAVSAPLSTRAVPLIERPATRPTAASDAQGSATVAFGSAPTGGRAGSPVAPTGGAGVVAAVRPVRRSRPVGLIVASVVVGLAGLALVLALVLIHPAANPAPAVPSTASTAPSSTTTTSTPSTTTTSTSSSTTTTSTSSTTTTSTPSSTTTTSTPSSTTTSTPSSTTTSAPSSTTTTTTAGAALASPLGAAGRR